MDLVDYRNANGDRAVEKLFAKADFPAWYLYHVMNGWRRITLARAQLLASLEPKLDVLELLEMQNKIAQARILHGTQWRAALGKTTRAKKVASAKKKSNGHPPRRARSK